MPPCAVQISCVEIDLGHQEVDGLDDQRSPLSMSSRAVATMNLCSEDVGPGADIRPRVNAAGIHAHYSL